MLPTFFQIIEKRLPEAQACADEHQVYLSFRPIPSTNQTAPATAIENCAAELRSWMISNMLMVDGPKAEFQIVGSKQQLERVGEGQITPGPVTSVPKPVWDFLLQLENGYANHKSLPKRLLSPPQQQENPKII